MNAYAENACALACAFELASRVHNAPNLEYRVLDVFNAAAVAALHEELGAPAYFASWIETNGMPLRLGRVLRTGVKPGAVSPERVRAVFPLAQFALLEEGELPGEPVPMRVALASSTNAEVVERTWAPPSYFAILGPRAAAVG